MQSVEVIVHIFLINVFYLLWAQTNALSVPYNTSKQNVKILIFGLAFTIHL